MKKVLYTILFFALLTVSAMPQNWQKIDSVFTPSGVPVRSFSAPFFCDLNGDGKTDLILGNNNDKAAFFYNIGTLTNPKFLQDTNVFASIYKDGITGTNSAYPVAVDLDGDSLKDLVIGGFNGLNYYKNIGSATHPEWQKDSTVFANINPIIGQDPKPAFADLDGDGDLDLFIGAGESILGGPDAGVTLGFRNIGTKLAPSFVLDSTLVAGIPDIGLNSFPAFADINNDGKIDLLLGRDTQTFVFFKNTGTSAAPVWTSDNSFTGNFESTTYWKDPTFCDLNGDGKTDIIYGTSSGNMYFYENNGTASAPHFVNNTNYFQVIKVYGAATVSFGDFDKDGKIDMLSGSNVGRFTFFKNTGTAENPVFTATSNAISNLSPGSYSTPVFVDLNNDGNLDIVSGSLGGKLFCYLNNNGSFTQNTTMFSSVDVSGFSAPAFGDINGDGNIDLLVGAENGTDAKFYLNTGNNTFVQNDTMMAGVTFMHETRPVFADVDGDGDLDLVFGSGWGDVVYYENKGDKNHPVWVKNDSLFANISVPQMASPGFANLFHTGRKDLVLGEYDGNFSLYKNLFGNPADVKVINAGVPANFTLMQNYPNPFNPSTTIRYSIPAGGNVALKVFDILGREVASLVNKYQPAGTYSVEFNASKLSSGIYFYTLQSGKNLLTKKLSLVK